MAPRAELGKRLQALIDRPERLAEETGARRSRAPAGARRALPNQGPVIRSQVSRLELLLPTFNQPVMLALESDNATEVAIQRVGFFGAFERREVELKPGKYTVTGKRSGFPRRAPRDHRGAGTDRTDHRHPLPGTDLK